MNAVAEIITNMIQPVLEVVGAGAKLFAKFFFGM